MVLVSRSVDPQVSLLSSRVEELKQRLGEAELERDKAKRHARELQVPPVCERGVLFGIVGCLVGDASGW
jgi:hypothetical protein